MSSNTELQTVDTQTSVAIDEAGFSPETAAQLMQMAKFIAQSELKPAGIKTASDAFLVMAYGMSYGFNAIMALQQLIVIKGKVGIPGETCAAMIQSHPQCRDLRIWVEGEGMARAGCSQSWRKGREKPNDVIRFTMADAKRAGLSGDNWNKYPDDMLIWKAVARDKRRNWPDVHPKLQVIEDYDDSAPRRESTREIEAPARPDPLMAQLGAAEKKDTEVKGQLCIECGSFPCTAECSLHGAKPPA